MRNKKYVKIGAVLLCMILSVSVFYWQVNSVKAEPADLWGMADAKEVGVNSKVNGRVVRIYVKEGDFVEKGQIIAAIDNDLQATEVMQAEAAMQAQYYQLQQSIIASQTDKQNSAANLKAAEAKAASAQAALDLAAKDEQRYSELLQQAAVSQQTYDTQQAKFAAAKASYDEAAAAVESARSGLLKNAANQEAENMQQEQLAALKGKLANVNVSVRETEIRAPFHGVITKKYVEEGSLVSAAIPLFSLQDTQDNWIDFKVKETDIDKYKLNQEVLLAGRNGQLEIRGKIVNISRKADFATVKATSERGDKDIITFNLKVQTNSDEVWPGMRFRLLR